MSRDLFPNLVSILVPARGEPPEPDEGGPVGEEVEGVAEEHGLDVGDDLHLAHVVVDLRLRADHPGVADGLRI